MKTLRSLRHPAFAFLALPFALALGACDGGEPVPVDEPEPDVTVDPPAPTEEDLPTVVGLDALSDENPDVGVVEYTLDIGVSSIQLLAGTAPTDVFAYNGMVPGPLMQARVGETVRIIATNHLDEPTTIHWHGLRIDYTMDGVTYGSLPSIAPGETFVYEFVPPEAGTFWYHPHVRTAVQVERGLYGMLIVHEREADRPDVDADRAFVMDDIRLNNDGTIAAFATSGMDIVHGRSGNILLVNGQSEPLSIPMAEGAVERWRLVNTANAREMLFRFPGLQVKEIGSDGGLWPQELVREIDEVSLPIGARAELEVRLAPGSTSGSLDSMVLVQDNSGAVVLAPFPMAEVSRDTSVTVETPRRGHFADPAYTPFSARPDIDHRILLEAFNQNGRIVMTINGDAFPNVPVWNVKQGELQVIKVTNGMPMNGHPFHLHGQFFQVIERNGLPTDEPGWRDTSMIPAGAGNSITIATWFDNPGSWMYHCHILEHAEAGMMAIVEVEPEE